MPPHPAFFVRTQVALDMGGYDLRYKIASDYDFLVRFFTRGDRALYVERLLTCMRRGGASNKSLANIATKMYEDYRIARTHRLGGLRTVAGKNLRKLHQLI
jgi:glycosyltransferase